MVLFLWALRPVFIDCVSRDLRASFEAYRLSPATRFSRRLNGQHTADWPRWRSLGGSFQRAIPSRFNRRLDMAETARGLAARFYRSTRGGQRWPSLGYVHAAAWHDSLSESKKENDPVDEVLNVTNGLPHSDVRGFLAISASHRWIATLAGLVEWLPGSKPEFRVYTQQDGLSDQEFSALALDSAGGLWVGTRNGGLNQLRERAISNISVPPGVAFSYADQVLETPSGQTPALRQRSIHCAPSAVSTDPSSELLPRLPA